MDARMYMEELIQKSRIAQKEFAAYTQEKVDEAVRAIGKAIYDHSEELAKLAVDETRMGVYEDKIVKNKGKSKAVWNKLKGVKSRGIIRYIEEEGLVEVAKPIGVIGAVTPTTNPTMTPIHNAMIALKGGNSLILSPHPRSRVTSTKTVELMRSALKEIGTPEDLIQVIPNPTLELSGLTMSMCDACISTGGPSMVKAAYSSGKPAFGVGAGNVQCLVDTDINIKNVVPKIVRGRTYDNGILCTCEQTVICPDVMYGEMVDTLVKAGAYFVSSQEEINKLRSAMFPNGMIHKDVVGASPARIAEMAGFTVSADTKLLLAPISKYGTDEALAKEKLCPVLSIYHYSTWEEAVNIALANLLNEGAGHSCIIHSNTRKHIEYAAEILPVSRFGINMIGSSGLGGGFDNGFNPTATLGCGSWGNNSLSENLWWHHLVNISRIGYCMAEKKIPADEEIWN